MNTEFIPIYNEVVRDDCYRLRSVPFKPDLIFDIGANVGVFTSFARFLFPMSRIVCVEPDERNYGLLWTHTGHLPDVYRYKAAIGNGVIRRIAQSLSSPWMGGVERYVTELGSECDSIIPVSLGWLCEVFPPTIQSICKIDIEGAERYLLAHDASLRALSGFGYIAMEIHTADASMLNALESLSDTHQTTLSKDQHQFRALHKGHV